VAEPIEMHIGKLNAVGPGNYVLDEAAPWRYLVNGVELSMCGGTVAFC